jgi:pimeloyl-ACP methyl ester carboxylesterase
MTPSLPTGLVLLAVHGSPGFPKDFEPLFREETFRGVQTKSLAANPAVIETALRASASENTVLIGYSWGAYAVLRTLLTEPTLHPRQVILVAPFLAPSEPLSGTASLLARTPLISDLIVRLSWKKWRDGLSDRMFQSKDLEAARDYLTRLDSTEVWKDVLVRKLEQQEHPLARPSIPLGPVHLVFGQNDRITDSAATESLLRSLGISFVSSQIAGAEHGLLWTHSEGLAHQIAQIIEKGSQP